MTVVYLDSVFVLNALMDYLLVRATAALAGVPVRRRRCLLAAALGGVYAAAVFLPGAGFLSAWWAKAAAGLLLAGAAFGGAPRFLRLTLVLGAVSCAFAGCVLALGLLSGGVPVENGIFYTDVDARVLLTAAGAAYALFSLVFRASAKHSVDGTLLNASITVGDKVIAFTALRDTGNALRDPLTGGPVLVVSADAVNLLWPAEVRPFLTARALGDPASALERVNRGRPRFRLLTCRTVGASRQLLLAFRCEEAVIGGERWEKLTVALSPTELGDGFAALWGGGKEGGGNGKGNRRFRGAFGGAGTNLGKTGAAAQPGRPLHRGQRQSAAAASAGAGGGASGAAGRGGDPADADRT